MTAERISSGAATVQAVIDKRKGLNPDGSPITQGACWTCGKERGLEHVRSDCPGPLSTEAGDMAALGELVATEYARHKMESGSFFNIRCECGYITETVSERGEFDLHVTDSIASAVIAAGWTR